jgi:hypothetical protein
VAEGTNGYKADMLHGIWAQAPYLHNGSVPTLGQLVCPATRPPRILRGNLHYDEALVGFEWAERPAARYSPHDTILIKEYDTTVPGKANSGHTFGADLCPDTSGLDPVADRKAIEERLLNSQVGALLAYLKHSRCAEAACVAASIPTASRDADLHVTIEFARKVWFLRLDSICLR